MAFPSGLSFLSMKAKISAQFSILIKSILDFEQGEQGHPPPAPTISFRNQTISNASHALPSIREAVLQYHKNSEDMASYTVFTLKTVA